MIQFDNGGLLVQDASELPLITDAKNIYLDYETTSHDPAEKSVNPWHHCHALGVAVTVDDCPNAWYVPIDHQDRRWNIDRGAVIEWLDDLLVCDRWINHNIKYDVHVHTNFTGMAPRCELVDTITLAKMIDSDRLFRGGYGLTALSRDWLNDGITPYEDALHTFVGRRNKNNKDYGAIPGDILGEYACQDVLTTRKLHDYIMGRMPEQCFSVMETEIKLTSILAEMERLGLRIDPTELKVAQVGALREMIGLEEEISNAVGYVVRPAVNEDCYDILINHFGLPVLGWTDEGNASFDKHALAKYATYPGAPKELVEKILRCRELSTVNSLFLTPYQKLQAGNKLHCTYNQSVRTGRMSCGEPNMQQLKKDIKKLIHPDTENDCFFSFDYSQIEFRLIVHYINDRKAIKAYNDDPYVDFHKWVAEMCGIDRRPAKNMNFCIGYGGGKGKMTSMLQVDASIIADLQEKYQGQEFINACARRADSVYEAYHEALPSLKPTSRAATGRCAYRGHVFNLYGRHRHLSREHAYKAFNALCQSSAADLMKGRMLAAHDFLQGTGVTIRASVHDEILFHGPKDVLCDPTLIENLVNLLDDPGVELSIPIRGSMGISDRSWYHANVQEKTKEQMLEELKQGMGVTV